MNLRVQLLAFDAQQVEFRCFYSDKHRSVSSINGNVILCSHPLDATSEAVRAWNRGTRRPITEAAFVDLLERLHKF